MANLVTNGNFSADNGGFASDYTYEHGKAESQEGVQPSYDVGKNPAKSAISWPDWAAFGDHTTGTGKMMLVNGGDGDVWRENIALDAGKAYTFSLWAHQIDNGSSGTGVAPQVQFLIDGHAIGTALTLGDTDAAGWQQLTFAYTPTTPTTAVSIQDLISDSAYNDFALDDISITKLKHGRTGSTVTHDHFDASEHAHLVEHAMPSGLHHGFDPMAF